MPEFQGQLLENEPLARYTSWRVGGPAKALYKPQDLTDLAVFLRQLPADEPILWLGLGSNTLVRDSGYQGTVIITQGLLNQIEVLEENLLRVEAGVACGSLARFSARHSLKGLEFMAGIPGTVGGALKMNAGCYRRETWDAVTMVETISQDGAIAKRLPNDYEVSYRHVNSKDQTSDWFVSGYFRLVRGDKEQSLTTIKELLKQRANSQPTSDHSCGSVFRNPPGDYAGRLIEDCGLKGYQHGGAQVSPKHANFIVNLGTASARDIEELINLVQKTVREKFSINLQRECHIFGE